MSWRRLAQGRDSLAGSTGGAAACAPMAPRQRPRSPGTYFQAAHPAWMVLIAAGMGYYGWIVFSPATIPCDCLGPLGTFTRYLVENHKSCLNVGYAIAWLIHVLETLYALKLCRDKGITDPSTQFRWAVQTILFGMASLCHLLSYNPPRKKKQ
uniref:transmembrane protein 254-like n=1 Tax=Euleptes europaea TaxID=460621 RepID=UPI0025408785|nr:transmembrane protein 254-like [Euleptes europaea]